MATVKQMFACIVAGFTICVNESVQQGWYLYDTQDRFSGIGIGVGDALPFDPGVNTEIDFV